MSKFELKHFNAICRFHRDSKLLQNDSTITDASWRDICAIASLLPDCCASHVNTVHVLPQGAEITLSSMPSTAKCHSFSGQRWLLGSHKNGEMTSVISRLRIWNSSVYWRAVLTKTKICQTLHGWLIANQWDRGISALLTFMSGSTYSVPKSFPVKSVQFKHNELTKCHVCVYATTKSSLQGILLYGCWCIHMIIRVCFSEVTEVK